MDYRIAALVFCVVLPALAVLAAAPTREHAETSISFELPAPPSVALPLFGPVRESEWSPQWSPSFLYPSIPSQIVGAVFTTGEEGHQMIWTLARYDEAAFQVSYVIVWPGMCATKLDIELKPAPNGTSQATVTNRRTALSEPGDKYVKEFAAEFPSQREHWRHAISHRLLEITK